MLHDDRRRKLDFLLQTAAIALVAVILIGFYLKILFF